MFWLAVVVVVALAVAVGGVWAWNKYGPKAVAEAELLDAQGKALKQKAQDWVQELKAIPDVLKPTANVTASQVEAKMKNLAKKL